MKRASLRNFWTAALVMLALAVIQLFVLIRKDTTGAWFLYGRDTVFHDAVVHVWVHQWAGKEPGIIPLWAGGIQGGIPTLGAFLWTPFSPQAWPFLALDYPSGQKLAWFLCLWVAGMGAFVFARAARLRFEAAVFCGAAWMLSGHLVTLIHAGHFQKVAALSWMGWAMAGAAMAADPHSAARRARGIGTGAIGLGMMFLGGHPQIAYLTLGMMALYIPWAAGARPGRRKRWLQAAVYTALMLGLGLAVGAAQLIPGLEMGGLSNRANGVGFEEAVETSYPPGELAEIAWPRVKGSSVRGDLYTGDWGERIVSDFAGRAVLLLAIVAVFGTWMRWRFVSYWLVVLVFSLLVGLGKYTPLYRAFHEVVPGFRSFRSPGTFMAAAMFAIPVLAGYGVNVLSAWWTRVFPGRRWGYALVYTFFFAAAAGDLAWANRFFLMAEPWQRYGQGYLGPNELDLWLIDRELAHEAHFLDPMPPGSREPSGRERSLRPILYNGRALNGYHPIHYGIKEEQEKIIGINNDAWYKSWGVTRLVYPVNIDAGSIVPPVEADQAFPSTGRAVFRLADSAPFVEAPEEGTARFKRLTPNTIRLEANGPKGVVSISEIAAPGLEISKDGAVISTTGEPRLGIDIEHGGGEAVYTLSYRPASYSHGLFATAAGLAAAFMLIVFGWRHRPPGFPRLVEEPAPDPNYGRPLTYRDFEVGRHSHGEVGERDA